MTWARTLGAGDGRRRNGGARAGAGRPISNAERIMLERHLNSKIVVKEVRRGKTKHAIKTVLVAMLDELRAEALSGNLVATKAYLDVTLGRPRTPAGKKPRHSNKSMRRALALSRIL